MARTTRGTRGKAKTGVVAVDFTGVESSGKVEEGRQLLTVDGAPEVKSSESSGSDYINWKFKAVGGSIWHTTSLQPQALWNLRNTLEALGLEVPEGAMDLDLSEVDGLTLGAEIEHETYQGKKRPRIIDLFPADELEEEEEEEETPKGKKPAAKGGKAKPEPEEEESELPTFAEVQEAEKDELLELAEEHEVKLTIKQKKSAQAIRDAICAALELEESEEEEEGDEPTYESVQEMSKDELIELAEENEIKLSIKVKKDLAGLRDFICEQLELEAEEEEEEKPKATSSRRKSSSKTIEKGSEVVFTDDGEEISGKVKSINAKEKFAVVLVDGEEWEVELDDLKIA